MKKTIRWITETAAMLALLICLQWVGSMIPEPTIKQLVTGTCVNAVLAITVLFAGMGSGITVAVISPVFAYTFGIAPNVVTVVPIMLGNVCYVVLLKLLIGKSFKPFWKQPVALVAAASTKFCVLYVLVVKVICGMASGSLLGKKLPSIVVFGKELGNVVVLAPKMLDMLPAMFAWPQLITALSGGILALLIAPTLKKALHR